MTDYTLTQGIQQARDNLIAITKLLVPDTTGMYSYVMPESSTAPYGQLFIGNTQYTRVAAGVQQFNINVRLRYVVERILAGYDGQTQNKGQWDYAPALIEGFERYGNLNYPGGTPVPLLDAVNTSVPTIQTAIEGQDYVLYFNWVLIFRTSIKRAC